MSLVLKRKNNSDEITAADDAILIYSALGDGILDQVYEGFQMSYNASTKILKILSGVCVFGGRMCIIEKGTYLELNLTSFSAITVHIMLEMVLASNDQNSSVSIFGSTTNSSTSSSPLVEGTHRIRLCTLNKNTGVFSNQFTRITAGVAKSAKNLASDGLIGSARFSEIFLNDLSGVRYARESDVAAEAAGFVGGSINKVEENLYMPNRGVYLLQRLELLKTTSSITIASGGYKEYNFQNGTNMSLNGLTIVMFVACDGSHNIGFPGTSASDVLLGSTNGQNIPNTYQGLTITLNKSRRLVRLTNSTNASITISGIKLYAFAYGGK